MRDFSFEIANPWLLLLLIPALIIGIIPFFRLAKHRRKATKHIIPFIIHNENRIQYVDSLKTAQTKGDYTKLTSFFEKEQESYMEQYKLFQIDERYEEYINFTQKKNSIEKIPEINQKGPKL